MKAIFTSVSFLVILTGHFCFGQSFSTRVSSKLIGKRDVLQVDYIAENAQLSDIMLPNFNNWTIISGPALTSNTMQTGNIVRSEIIYTITLQPKATGRLIVPGASAKVGNVRKVSNAVLVDVKNIDHVGGNAQQRPFTGSMLEPQPRRSEFGGDQFLKRGENARDKIKNNLMVRVDANKRSVVVGEPILVTYKLYTRLRSQSKVVVQPTFNGCTVIEMTTDNPVPTKETVNGRSYNVYVIRRVQLVPLQEGKLLLPETGVENKVAFYDASTIDYRGLYYDPSGLPVEEQTVTLRSIPQFIEIKPLPPIPVDASPAFSGGVGRFNITAGTLKPNVETNHTNELVVSIEGEGNMQQIKAPAIQWPQGFEAFEPKVKELEDKSFFPLRARKTFTYPFVVNKVGAFRFGQVGLTYFDPFANKYVTKNTAPLTMQVVKGSAVSNIFKRSPNSGDGFQTRLLILLGAGLLAIVIGLVWYNEKHKIKPKTPAANIAAAAIKVEKKEAAIETDTNQFIYRIRELQPQDDQPNFYKLLCKNIHGFVEAKFDVKPSALKEYILNHKGDTALLEQLQSLLDHCSLGMYTPLYTVDEAMQHRLLAIEVLCKLDKQPA